MKTFTTLKILLGNKKICQENQPCIMKFPEEKTFKNENDFQNIPNFSSLFCVAEYTCGHSTEGKGADTEKSYHQKPVSLIDSILSDLEHILPSAYHQ